MFMRLRCTLEREKTGLKDADAVFLILLALSHPGEGTFGGMPERLVPAELIFNFPPFALSYPGEGIFGGLTDEMSPAHADCALF
jgi:hypothetical protein